MVPKDQSQKSPVLIGIVGPCSSGKSTLIAGLRGLGISARHIAQEHSYVQYMWQNIVNPDILIYLDVSYTISMSRRHLDMSQSEFGQQENRLLHARQHANLYIQTDRLSPQEVLHEVTTFLKESIK